MTQAERIIRACHEALDPGPFGATLRADDYKKFVAVGRSIDLSRVKTSCAVFVHGILHFAGRTDRKIDVIGQGIFDGWLEGLTYYHPAWKDAVDKDGKRRRPPAGAIFYRAYSKASSGKESHVGIFVFETSEGQWITAEGGGSPSATEAKEWGLSTTETLALNGTLCRLSKASKDVWANDSLGRSLVGWWCPELLDGFVAEGEATTMTSRIYKTTSEGAIEVNGTIPLLPTTSLQSFRDKVMRWGPLAKTTAWRHDVPLHWVIGIIGAESGGNPAAKSADGGYGLMQLTHPSVFDGQIPEDTRDAVEDQKDDVTDPALNIELGTDLLRQLRATLGDDLPKVASAYNAGLNGSQPYPSATSPWGYRESPGYIDRVVANANSALMELLGENVAFGDMGYYTKRYVREWQRLLGITDDGKFGAGTLAASKKAIGK